MDIDFHNHSQRSVDCEADTELKVRDFLAEGLDSIVATEHDNIFNYASEIENLGVKNQSR
jgi:histidinol phosphatase-like PHP family hydrolase